MVLSAATVFSAAVLSLAMTLSAVTAALAWAPAASGATSSPPQPDAAAVGNWSRPVAVATTEIEARPALAVEPGGRTHVFYLDRGAEGAVVSWAVVEPDGRIAHEPRTLGRADPRAAWVAAAAAGREQEIVVAWVAPSGEGMRVASLRVLADGSGTGGRVLEGNLQGPQADDAGPIALAASPAGVHAIWSQASGGRRLIWYLGPGMASAAPVGPGDAPALSVGPEGPVGVWWERTGFDTYRLVATGLGGSASRSSETGGLAPASVRPLTGNLATSVLEPPAAVHDASGRLHVIYGTTIRGLGPAVSRLTSLQVASHAQGAPARLGFAAASPWAAHPAAIAWLRGMAVAWADQRSGRSRTPEIYAAAVEEGVAAEHRLTYSLRSSLRPALAADGGALTVAWLEVLPGGRFELSLATTARPARRLFLMGIPELDIYRPGGAAAFALTALLGALPYAAMMALATALLTAAVVSVGRAVFEETRWWRWLAASAARSALASLALALGLLSTAVGALFPFVPRLGLAPAVAVLALAWAALHLRGRDEAPLGWRLAFVLAVVFAAASALAFTWAAGALSQLAT